MNCRTGHILFDVSTVDYKDPFDLQSSPRVVATLDQARARIEDFVAIDRENGESPGPLPIDLALRTVMSAIHAGLESLDWECVEDAFVMLQQTECFIRSHATPDKTDQEE